MLDTERFLIAQESAYPIALREMQAGQKRSHWIWYIFPQLTSLGRSDTAKYYGIDTLADAKAYLSHPILGQRLCEITDQILKHTNRDPVRLMGSYVDAVKLRSSMTLFREAADDPTRFDAVLAHYFESKPDRYTLERL
ncbi:MAG: DUF1810 domain-containing protein [Clostridia bacterium]|nr:DUF1810 domain-containing protein [Clostridia bacterium]